MADPLTAANGPEGCSLPTPGAVHRSNVPPRTAT